MIKIKNKKSLQKIMSPPIFKQNMSENQSVSAQSTFVNDEMLKNIQDEKEATEKINQYKKQYKSLINNLDFDKAKEIEEEIKQITADQANKKVEYLKKDFDQRLMELIENHKSGRKRVIRSYYHKELDARLQVSDRFILLQKDHVMSLCNLQQQMVDEYTFKEERPVQKLIELFERAKQFALSQNFEEAQRLKDKAEKLKTKQTADIKKEMVRSYKKKIYDMLEQQGRDLDNLSEKAKNDIESMSQAKRKALENQMTSSKILASKFFKKYQTTIAMLRLNEEEAKSINRYIRKRYVEVMRANKLYDENEEANLKQKQQTASPTKSPRKGQKEKFISRRDFIEREFKVELRSRAAQRAIERSESSATSTQLSSQY